MAHELERIRVEGYKSIRELDLELRPLNVLIGANGSGKTNFISVFRLLNEILQERLQTYSGRSGADSLLYYGRKTTEAIEILVKFYTPEKTAYVYNIRLQSNDSDILYIEKEELYEVAIQEKKDYLTLRWSIQGNRESQLARNVSTTYVSKFVNALSSWKIYHFHDTSETSKMKQTQNLFDNERLLPDASNIAAFLYLLQEQHSQYYRKIVKTIKRVTPFFDDFVLRPNPLNPETIRLQWRDTRSDNLFNASALSDGTLRFICLATLLLQPELPSVILIDEPELGLHPFAINILVGMLRSASTQTQVIISTQSVPLVNQFLPEDIIVVDRKDGQSTFERLKQEDLEVWMSEYSDYGLGDLWEKNVIGGRPQREVG